MNSHEQQLFDRLARDIRREVEPQIAEGTRELDAMIDRIRETLRSTPAPPATPPTPAPAPPAPAPEPSLAERLEAMAPQDFYEAMRSDPKAMLARLAQADQEG